MIELSRSNRTPAPEIKIIGLGGAGQNVLDRLILDGLDADLAVAVNTDAQALNGSVAQVKVALGQDSTRGLGAGGDPELGYAAAEESEGEIRDAIGGAGMVFICAGLGGGTGSGAAPLVAHLARKAGAFVVAFVTLPFAFEGRRRSAQAADALAQIEAQADLVVCFENDRMSAGVAPSAGVQEAFVVADQMLSGSVRAVAALVRQRGLIALGLGDLIRMLRRRAPRCLFGHGESDGPNRAHEALERALRSPLMDRGRLLADAHSVLIHVTGGTELTLNEVTVLMEEFNRHVSDTTRIHFGLGTDPALGRRICVAILASDDAGQPAEVAAPTPAARKIPAAPPRRERAETERAPEPAPHAQECFDEPDDGAPAADDAGEIDDMFGEPAPRATPGRATAPKYAPQPAAAKKETRAEQMPLEPANRGRFEKSEPTIVDGQDLDVPTFLRKKMKLK